MCLGLCHKVRLGDTRLNGELRSPAQRCVPQGCRAALLGPCSAPFAVSPCVPAGSPVRRAPGCIPPPHPAAGPAILPQGQPPPALPRRRGRAGRPPPSLPVLAVPCRAVPWCPAPSHPIPSIPVPPRAAAPRAGPGRAVPRALRAGGGEAAAGPGCACPSDALQVRTRQSARAQRSPCATRLFSRILLRREK